MQTSPTFRHSNLSVIAEQEIKFAHEAPVIFKDFLYFVSNRLKTMENSSDQEIILNRMNLDSGKIELDFHRSIPMPNGAILLKDSNQILFAAQGNLSHPAGLYLFDPLTLGSKPLLTTASSWFKQDNETQISFNSPNDVVVYDRFIYFTDPSYGFEQGFRPAPGFGNWVWRVEFNSSTSFIPEGIVEVRPVLDSLVKPNGLAFSSDFKNLFLSDSGYFSGDGQRHAENPRSIYKFDMVEGLPVNKQLFAVARFGIPDGLKVDPRRNGNVYSGCGDGVEVFNENGSYVGLVEVQGGVSNFALALVKNEQGLDTMAINNASILLIGLNENRIIKTTIF